MAQCSLLNVGGWVLDTVEHQHGSSWPFDSRMEDVTSEMDAGIEDWLSSVG